MKLNLRPGVSPAQFWTTVGVGLGGTAATALGMTAYAWAPTVISLLGLLILFFQSRFGGPPPQPPPAAPAPQEPEGLEGGRGRPNTPA